MRKILLPLLLLNLLGINAQITTNKYVYEIGEKVLFSIQNQASIKKIILKDISIKGEPIITEINSSPYIWIIPINTAKHAIGIFAETENGTTIYVNYFRIIDNNMITTYDIEKRLHKGLDIYLLNGGMSAEYTVQKSLENLTAGISHTWLIGKGGGPNPVWGVPDFLEKSLDKTIELYNKNLGYNTQIETVIISTGIPNVSYLSATMQAPVLPIHYLVSVKSTKEISSILKYSTDMGTSCYATLGYDGSMSDVGVAWIKLLNLPKQYKQFIKEHQVKNIIIVGIGEDSQGESYCRKIKNTGLTYEEYANGSIYILYTNYGSEQDIAAITTRIADYDNNKLETAKLLADWESAITNNAIINIKQQVNSNTTAKAYSLISPTNMMVMYNFATYTALEFINKNKTSDINTIAGITLNEYLISHPIYELIQNRIPLLYWQLTPPSSTIDRVDGYLKEAVLSYFPSTKLTSANVHVNARLKKANLVAELHKRGYVNVTQRRDNQEEIWEQCSGMASPCELLAEEIATNIGSETYKKRCKGIMPLTISELSSLAKKVSGIQFSK